ncbi:type VI secretion system protein TssA [Pseudomonas aeruginosa]
MSLVNPPPIDMDILLAPVDKEHPAGAFDEEDNAFQEIDHEMVKLGGLQEPNLDWRFVDEASRQYLIQQCKHFRIAGHLVTARLREPSWRGWGEAVGVLAGMVDRYWETGHPKPGPTGYPAKRRQVALLAERLSEALLKLPADDMATPHQEAARQALDRLQACAESAKLDVPLLTRLETQFTRRVEETRIQSADPIQALDAAEGGRPISEAYFKPVPTTNLGDERESKRTLLAVADFINEQNAYDPTGYLLRRFALWGHLTAPPTARNDQRTELAGVPLDTVEAYREALATSNISPVLLQRVEKSVSNSPYWLQGSFFAAALAQRMEMPEVASAIRLAVERFVLRMPGLKALHFADGRPFVDGETLTWLSGANEQSSATTEGREYAALRDELSALLEGQGVEHVLKRLEQLQTDAEDPRHRCHILTIAADLVAARGFTWLANGLYDSAHRLMDGASIAAWEPVLHNHLAARVHATQPSGHPGNKE